MRESGHKYHLTPPWQELYRSEPQGEVGMKEDGRTRAERLSVVLFCTNQGKEGKAGETMPP